MKLKFVPAVSIKGILLYDKNYHTLRPLAAGWRTYPPVAPNHRKPARNRCDCSTWTASSHGHSASLLPGYTAPQIPTKKIQYSVGTYSLYCYM
jgi:hypothetical protein